jgi:hypothetical protein
MPTSIDRQEVQRLLADQQAQVVEVLPAAEHADEQPARGGTIRPSARLRAIVERMQRQNLTTSPPSTRLDDDRSSSYLDGDGRAG